MKNAEETAKALVTLLENAETEFEKHRIEILIRDLLEPPKVEVIDENHQKFNGVTYRKISADGHYAVSHRYLHRDIYEYVKSEIPEGYHIHHKDYNPANNDIENLQLVSKKEHREIHLRRDFKKIKCEHCGKMFLAPRVLRNKYCSEKCFKAHQKEIRYCEVCGAEFTVLKNAETKYCSEKCAQYAIKADHREERICKNCGKVFTINIASPRIYCSRKCANEKKALETHIQVECPICGKIFTALASKKRKYCSRACALKAQYPDNRIQKTCPICGKTFETYKSHETTYCSPQCAYTGIKGKPHKKRNRQ